jgi:hypothetical protein
MRRILHQRMLEGIDRIGWRAALKNELGRDDAGESRLQLVLGQSRESGVAA